MAAKPGWICSACSNGSACSLRSIRCVRALSRYTFARPVEQQIIDRRVGFDHDNYRSIANGFWLITSARVYCECGCPTYTRRNGARFLPQVYRKHTSVCPNNLISILVTISISARWFVGAFDCQRVGLSTSWLSANWIVGKLVCRRVVQLLRTTTTTTSDDDDRLPRQ